MHVRRICRTIIGETSLVSLGRGIRALERGTCGLLLLGFLSAALMACSRGEDVALTEARRLMEQGDYEGAAARLEVLLERDPSHQEARYQLGQVYAAQQRYAEALTQYEMALSLDPSRQDIKYAIGKVAWKLGRKRAAAQAFLNILQSSATEAQVREMLELTGEMYQVRRLTFAKAASASPVFSPDGKRIAFVRTEGRINHIWIMDIDGRNARRLTPPGASDASPQFSPDGSKILFSSRSTEDPTAPAAIYIMNRDGSDRRLLVRADREMLNPSFSADGREIIFEQNDTGTPEGWEIFRFDGKRFFQLTHNQVTDVGPKISPDGRSIVFASTRDGHPDNYEIYLMNVDGSNVRRLTHHPAVDNMPNFSADGEEIAFVSDRDGNEEIYTIRRDGTQLRRLTYCEWKDTTPAFSPDGRWIAFASVRDSDYLQIYLLDRSRMLGRADLLARLRKLYKRGW